MASIRERRRADGTSVFNVQVRFNGHPPQTATFLRKTDAKRWAAEVEAAMRHGRYFKPTVARQRTLGDAIDRFLEEVAPTKPHRKRDFDSHLAEWKRLLGSYALAELSPNVIGQARDKMLRTRTVRKKLPQPATVLRKLASLSAVLKVAEREWSWIDQSPMGKVTKPSASRCRVRYLSDQERTALLNACAESKNKYLHTIVLVAISTGMRLGEIMNLRWEHLDVHDGLQVGHARLLKTKNGEARGVPVAGPALEALRALAKKTGKSEGLVFPSERSEKEQPIDIRRPWNDAVARAKLNDFRFHDLRHSAASYLAMNGATHTDIAAILGHKTLAMVKRYAHLSPAHTASVVARMTQRVFGEEAQQ